jgi:hypothetical protein
VAAVVVNVGPSDELALVGSTSNVLAFDVPPPGDGVCTVITAVPAEAIPDAATCADNWVVLAKVVSSALDPQ